MIQKVLRGELLDSQKNNIPEKELISIFNEDGSNLIIFPDGSRIKVDIESTNKIQNNLINSNLNIGTLGASTGTIKLSCSTKTTCTARVRYYDMIWDVKYDATVNLYNGGSPGIKSISNFRADAVLYSIEKLNKKIVRYNATSSSPAKAKWQFKATFYTGIYTLTRDLAVYVDKNSNVYARLEWDD